MEVYTLLILNKKYKTLKRFNMKGDIIMEKDLSRIDITKVEERITELCSRNNLYGITYRDIPIS